MRPKPSAVIAAILLLVFLEGCTDKDPLVIAEICVDITCSGHGTCAVTVEEEPICACDAGYYADGLSCVLEGTAGPCTDVTCSDHGTCIDVDGQPECRCDEGYHAEGLACVEEHDLCIGVDCAGHGVCEVVEEVAVCNCDPGYYADGLICLQEVDPWTPISLPTPIDITDQAVMDGYGETAVTANGVADDTDNLEAINGNSSITNWYIPSGKTVRAYQVQVQSHVEAIFGEGTIESHDDGRNDPDAWIRGAIVLNETNHRLHDNFVIDGLHFTADSSFQGREGYGMITISQNEPSTITNVEIRNCTFDGQWTVLNAVKVFTTIGMTVDGHA